MSMGRTPSLGPYQVYSFAYWAKPPLESNHGPKSAAVILPTRRPNSATGIFPLGDLDCHYVVGLTPARSRRIQSVAGSHPISEPFLNLQVNISESL